MRFALSCLLLTFLTACQTAQPPRAELIAATRFPTEKWSSQSVGGPLGTTYFTCAEEKCGEKVLVAVRQNTLPSLIGSTTLEDMLRLRSVNDAFLKEAIGLVKGSFDPTNAMDIRTIRKISSEPLGIYAEGTAKKDGQTYFFAAEERVIGNRVAVAMSMASSLKSAQNSLRLVHLPSLLK